VIRLAARGRQAAVARRTLARGGVVVVAAAQAEIGIWGLLAPHSFYTSFPGDGRHWVSVLGPYDEHLVRDFAAMELGFAVLLACAAVWFERRLVLVAGAAFLAATIPHLAYHLTMTRMFSTSDNVASLGGFVIELALVAAAMVESMQSVQSVQSLRDCIGSRFAAPGPDLTNPDLTNPALGIQSEGFCEGGYRVRPESSAE
jgi:hypothetical protein